LRGVGDRFVDVAQGPGDVNEGGEVEGHLIRFVTARLRSHPPRAPSQESQVYGTDVLNCMTGVTLVKFAISAIRSFAPSLSTASLAPFSVAKLKIEVAK